MKDRFCPVPFQHGRIGEDGIVNICCSAWVKGDAATAGNLQNGSLDQIWNSEKAQKFRQSIHDGTFKYCDVDSCPSLSNLPKREDIKDPYIQQIIENQQTTLPSPKILALNYDYSCTLSCPMCRAEKYMASGEEYKKLRAIHKRVEDVSEPPETLIVTGTGDAFGSKLYRDFLADFDKEKYQGTRLIIRTNSDIFTEKMWNYVAKCHDNVEQAQVSVDAARPASYAIVRRGGEFSRLNRNMEFVSRLRAQGKIPSLILYFTVQLLNFEEIPEMIALAEKWNADQLNFNQLRPGGEILKDKFTLNSVHFQRHPRFADFVSVMRDVPKNKKFVRFAPGLLQQLPDDVKALF